MSQIRRRASLPTLEQQERLIALLFDIEGRIHDPAWIRERSVEELIALITASLQSIAAVLPGFSTASPAAAFLLSAQAHARLQALAKEEPRHTTTKQNRRKTPRPR